MQGAELFRLFVKFFGCGTVYIRSDSSRCDFIVQDLDSVLIKVLPHFDLYPLQNIKQKDYLDFKEGLSIIRSGLHLNRDGLAKFKAIKVPGPPPPGLGWTSQRLGPKDFAPYL